MKVGADGRLYVTDIFASGIHVLKPDGTPEGFIACEKATTNCVFDGETLWVTNAGVLRRQAATRPSAARFAVCGFPAAACRHIAAASQAVRSA